MKCMWKVSGESRPSSHHGLFGESRAPDALLSWGSSVLTTPALLQGKGVCAGRQCPPHPPTPCPVSSVAHHPALCLLDVCWTCSWGFWALSPAPFFLTLEWGKVCVCVCARECVVGKCLSMCGRVNGWGSCAT